MNIRAFVVVICAGLCASVSHAAGGNGGGISDISNADRAAVKRTRQTTEAKERGGVGTAIDPEANAVALPPSSNCDFAGFVQGELVNNAYAGGTGSNGTVRSNLGISFSGTNALNTWNGCCAPDAGIAYSPAGSMIISSTNSSLWRGIDFHFASTVSMTVQVWSGVNATGTLLQSVTVPANLVSGPYSTWTLRQLSFPSLAMSVKILGSGNYWGVDRVTPLIGCPAPTSASDDCNGNGQSDACEIAYGLVQDCNGNGTPDSCDIAPQPFAAARNGSLAISGGTVYSTFTGLPVAVGNVAMRFEVTSDIDNGPNEGVEFVLFTAGGGTISVNLVSPSGSDCTTEVRNVSVPASVFNAARTSTGELLFAIKTGPATNFTCSHVWKIDMSYSKVGASDCNANGIPDSCEIANGSLADCNGNGLPDVCDIAGGMADCNGNGALDSCELANGTAVDQNGNGVPDSCDPFPSLTLTANAAACNAVGSVVQVDARLSGVLNLVVAGQVVLNWDASKLQLLSAGVGDSPYVVNYVVDNVAGQAVILVSSNPGGSGTTAPAAVVSRLQFQVLGGSCNGSGTAVGFGVFGPLSTEFTDGFGRSIVPTLIGSTGFVVDDGAPVLAGVPANVTVQAQAGEGAFANVSIGAPTASDACVPGLTPTGVRSDGRAMGAGWPVGTTTVTWTASDPCGNVTSATTLVTVLGYNTLDLSADWGTAYGPGSARSLKISVLGSGGLQNRVMPVVMNGAGMSAWSITDLPIGTYTCATVEDPARSLKRRVSVSDTGSVWTAAKAMLVLGDIIDDEVVDVLDWGAYVVRNTASDLNGDGVINATDGNIILANFGVQGDAGCSGPYSGSRPPVTAITVSELVDMGMPELAGADLNGDGWVDGTDMDLFSH